MKSCLSSLFEDIRVSTFENHLNPAISQNPHFSNAEESVARLWNLMKFYWNFISGIWTLWAQKCPSVPTSKAQTRTRLQLRRIATQCTLINSNISQIYSNMKININSYANPKSLEHESGLAIFMMFQLSQSKPKNVQIFPHREVLRRAHQLRGKVELRGHIIWEIVIKKGIPLYPVMLNLQNCFFARTFGFDEWLRQTGCRLCQKHCFAQFLI